MAISSALRMASAKTLATNPTSSPLLRRKPSPLFLSPLFKPSPQALTLSLRRCSESDLIIASSSPSPPIPGQNPTHSPLTGLAQTIATHFALVLALSELLASKISLLSPKLDPKPLSTALMGPLFFSCISSDGRGPRSMGTLIAVFVAKLAKWLDIFLIVLQIRVLLSLFPNIEWDKPPMSAIRNLFEPDPSLFRAINPTLAFLLLGMLRVVSIPS